LKLILGQKCFRRIVQQAVAQLEQVGVFAESATTELFHLSGKYCKFDNSSTARISNELESN
ncbi:hypothetical protein, partial [Vibrio splendidus]|uniref:hypothetical protein n=1 Tax=Vibrio splendidus TaxID=29497 RepID=UPI001C62A8EC